MNNEKLKVYLENLRKFSFAVLKQMVMMLIAGLMALLYYEAGTVRLFDGPEALAETCAQRDKELKKTADEYVRELNSKTEGVVDEK
jgi:hypothetical protein